MSQILFTRVDVDESQKLAREFNTKQNMCHYNTWMINLVYPNLKRFTGYVLREKYVTVHSWLVKNNLVIDPTLILCKKIGEQYLGEENNG